MDTTHPAAPVAAGHSISALKRDWVESEKRKEQEGNFQNVFFPLCLMATIIVIALVTDLFGHKRIHTPNNDVNSTKRTLNLCEINNGNGTETLNNCTLPEESKATEGKSSEDSMRREFIPIVIPLSTGVCIVAIFIGLYGYLYMKEKQLDLEREQQARSSYDYLNDRQSQDFREWRESAISRYEMEAFVDDESTDGVTKNTRFDMPSFTLDRDSKSTGISFVGRPTIFLH